MTFLNHLSLTYQKQFSYGDVEWEKFTTFFHSELLVTPPTIFQSYHLVFLCRSSAMQNPLQLSILNWMLANIVDMNSMHIIHVRDLQ